MNSVQIPAKAVSGGSSSVANQTTSFFLRLGFRLRRVLSEDRHQAAVLPLDRIRRPRDTPIWKLEASLNCRSCRKGRYAPPVRMIKLTKRQEITPYKWVHPDEER